MFLFTDSTSGTTDSHAVPVHIFKMPGFPLLISRQSVLKGLRPVVGGFLDSIISTVLFLIFSCTFSASVFAASDSFLHY